MQIELFLIDTTGLCMVKRDLLNECNRKPSAFWGSFMDENNILCFKNLNMIQFEPKTTEV